MGDNPDGRRARDLTHAYIKFDFGYFVTTFGYTKSKPCGFFM
jgi:hypothetical protein